MFRLYSHESEQPKFPDTAIRDESAKKISDVTSEEELDPESYPSKDFGRQVGILFGGEIFPKKIAMYGCKNSFWDLDRKSVV